MSWTEERTETLKRLWADGLSASQCAERIGEVTRNAVIGKVHRLGLAGRSTTSRQQPRRRQRRPGWIARSPAPRPTPPRPPVAAAQHAVPAIAVELEPTMITVLDIGRGQCRWPIGDPREASFGFCGHHANGSWCDHHHHKAVNPPRR